MLKPGCVLLCSTLVLSTGALAWDPPPPLIPGDALVENYQRDPVIFVHGIMGARLIKQANENGRDIVFLSLPSVLGQPWQDLVTDGVLKNADGSEFETDPTGKKFDQDLYDRLIHIIAKNQPIATGELARPLAETQVLDRVELFNDDPGLQKLSEQLTKDPMHRSVPLLGSSQALYRFFMQSQIPGLADIGQVGEFLDPEVNITGMIDLFMRPGVAVYEKPIRRLIDMGYDDETSLARKIAWNPKLRGTSPSLFVFSYDWRQNNLHTAAQLKHFIESNPHLQGKKVRIVAHSMGNIVTMLYVNALGGHERVKSITQIAPPLHGATAALWYLMHGNPSLDPFYGSEAVRDIMFWSPALWQLLPRDAFSLRDQNDKPLLGLLSSAESYQSVKPIVFMLSKQRGENREQLRRRLVFVKLNIYLNDIINKIIEEDRETLCAIEEARGASARDASRICGKTLAALYRIPQLKVIAKNTPEAATLSQLRINTEAREVTGQLFNNQGDGTVPFFSTLTARQFRSYQLWNADFTRDMRHFRYASRESGLPPPSIIGFPVEVLARPLEELFGGTPGAVDFMASHLPRGVRLDKRTTFKIIPRADHISLMNDVDTWRSVRLWLRDELITDPARYNDPSRPYMEPDQAFSSHTIAHPTFGALRILWRTYGDDAEACRPFIKGALGKMDRQLLNAGTSDGSSEEEKLEFLKKMEAFNHFSIFSMSCRHRRLNGKFRMSLFAHDYDPKWDLAKSGILGPTLQLSTVDLPANPTEQEMKYGAFSLLRDGAVNLLEKHEWMFYPSLLIRLTPYKEGKHRPIIHRFP